jgi:hypothetical protein
MGTDELPADGAASPAGVNGSAPAEGRKLDYDRVSIALDPKSGAIQWDIMRPATVEKLREGLRNPESIKRLRLAPATAAAASKAPTANDLALCGVLYDAASAIAVSLARAAGYSADHAEVLRYSAEEKATLLEPTAKVFAKYARDFKYTDELVLTLAIVTVTGAKITAMKQAAEKGLGVVGRIVPASPIVPIVDVPEVGPQPS